MMGYVELPVATFSAKRVTSDLILTFIILDHENWVGQFAGVLEKSAVPSLGTVPRLHVYSLMLDHGPDLALYHTLTRLTISLCALKMETVSS
jgi:hypothetical protein